MDIPPSYLRFLSPENKKKQTDLIIRGRRQYENEGIVEDRPRVSDQKTPRSKHAKRFEERYGFSVVDTDRVKALFPDSDIDTILSKGRGAYGSSGSRPNVTMAQWANARLASVLTGGPALRIDKDLVGPISLAKIR
jgi:hypothetical protein